MIRRFASAGDSRGGVSAAARLLLLLALVPGAGCASWRPGWDVAAAGTPAAAAADPEAALARAQQAFREADDAARLEQAIRQYESVLAADPGSYAALAGLCESTTLLGAAYTGSREDKRSLYRQAMRFCERALYTNDRFRQRIEAGETFEDALQAIGERELQAAIFWVTSVSYYFKEGLRGLGRLRHYPWMVRSRSVMERISEVDPDYGDGAVYFSWGIYYLALPKSVGGDREKSAAYLEQAIEAAPTALLPRWGRAKYFHTHRKDRQGFLRDLEWVVAQEPRAAAGTYSWNVYFQRDARRMLADPEAAF